MTAAAACPPAVNPYELDVIELQFWAEVAEQRRQRR